MAVLLYVNWDNGTLSSGTYTAATPDIPNGHTYTFANSATVGVDNDSPWSGQTLAELTAWNKSVSATLSSSTMQATSGRIYVEWEGELENAGASILYLAPTSANNGKIL